MTLRGMGFGKKAKTRGRETKCYINWALWDRLEARFTSSFNQERPYGYINDLINDCLLERVEHWDRDGAVTPLTHIEAHKAGATENHLSLLLRFIKDDLNSHLAKLAGKAHSKYGFTSQLMDEDGVEIRRLQDRLMELTRAAFLEVDLVSAPPLEPPEPADTTPKFTKEERDKVANAFLKSQGLEP